MKIVSWNVNGVRAVMKKDFESIAAQLDADVLGLQETKAQDDQVSEALESIPYNHLFSSSAEKKGYSGTAVLSKEKPLSVEEGIGIAEHDTQGRVVTAEYEQFFVINVYVPNSGSGLSKLDYRETWDQAFLEFIKAKDAKKPVIVMGDFNVCHQRIDIARPDANYNKSAGYTQKEIDGMQAFLDAGLVDTFRHFYPDEVRYSWWSYRAGARGKNIGWRLDYVLVSERFLPNVKDSFILTDILGSDHCPVGVELEL